MTNALEQTETLAAADSGVAAPRRAPADVSASDLAPAHLPLRDPVGPLEIAEAIPEEVNNVGDVMRQSAELTLDQARSSYERVREMTEQTTVQIEAAMKAASAGALELNAKALDALQANTDAAIDFVRAMSGARTLSDVVALQGEHMRKQFVALHSQAREFSDLATKLSARTVAPISEAVGKTFGAAT